MEKLLNEIKQYRKEQAKLLDWNKHNGHTVMVSFDEGGLNACDKIIAIVERALAERSDEIINCNKQDVSLCTCDSEKWAEEKPRSDGFWYCKNCGKQF